MDLKEFFNPCKEKIKMFIAIVAMSVNLMIFGIYFTRFHSLENLSFLPGLILIIIWHFYLPVKVSIDIFYIIVSGMNPDIDYMTSSQIIFHFGLMIVLSCVYVYFITCIIFFIHRKRMPR